MLFLICQPNVHTEIYQFSFNCLHHFALLTQQKPLFRLLGDLLDQHIFGSPSLECFERRLQLYLESGCSDRICALLFLVHQKVFDCSLKQQIEAAICQTLAEKQRYSADSFRFMLAYSSSGITKPLSSAFTHFNFAAFEKTSTAL